MSHYNAVTKVNTKTAAETAEFVVNLPRKKTTHTRQIRGFETKFHPIFASV